jgi:hypothetical protein
MVKRDSGFDATTRDWEFFALDVSKNGTRIQNEEQPMLSINLAETAFNVMSGPLRSGTLCARPTTVALYFRLRLP